jgi:hypothetical protein
VLSPQHVAELNAAIAAVERRGVPTAQIHVSSEGFSTAVVWGSRIGGGLCFSSTSQSWTLPLQQWSGTACQLHRFT